MNATAEIFARSASFAFESLEAEREAIAAAKGGDNTATDKLLRAYAPVLRSAVAAYLNESSSATYDADEVRATALLGFVQAVNDFDPETHARLAAIVKKTVVRTLCNEFLTPSSFSVPARTLQRFYGILRAAEGNVFEATALAPKFDMSKETFLAVLSAVRNVDSLDGASADDENHTDAIEGARPLWDGTATDAEDAVLVAAAFNAVDDLEEDVCRLSYGFADYEPVPDAEIGHRLGLSRQKTQRTRSAALGKMRLALGVA